jgi:hypothetical protein
MRVRTSLHLLLLPAALLTAGCEDDQSPFEPPAAEEPAPRAEPVSGPLEDLAYWADGYILLGDKTAASTAANPTYSFNRSGGAITTTRVPGTTGRYTVTFRGLSGALGSKSSVHVSAVGADPSYCKPVGGTLVSDKVEVRCYKVGTGVPINSLFTLMVIGKTDARGFAFANQPTATDYAPAGAGSWNPTGATRVFREGVGRYRVVFKGLGARFPTNGGHVEVNATGTGKTHCKSVEQGTRPDFQVLVWCFTPAGAPADAKFTLVVTPPAAHLAYALANVPAAASYTPDPTYSWNPVGGAVSVTRSGVGAYFIKWTGIEAEIRDVGNVQVTAYSPVDAQCIVQGWLADGALIRCLGSNGLPVDAQYSVMMHS